MKRVLAGIAAVAALVLASILGLGLAARSLVSGAGKDALLHSLEQRLGAPVSVARAELDLEQLLRLRPALALKDVAIGNVAGFKARNLLHVDSVSAQFELLPLLQKNLLIHTILVDRPRVAIERNARGETNLELLLRGPRSPASSPAVSTGEPARGGELAVESLSITNAEILLPEGVRLSGLDLHLRGFSRGNPCEIDATARLIGASSKLSLQGQAGPFGAGSLPLDGKFTLTLALAEIPAAIRQRELGKLFAAPGAKARLTLAAAVKGNLYGSLAGPATLKLSEILVGKDAGHVLPLSGEAPIVFTVERPLSSPAIGIRLTNARFQYGAGEWRTTTEIRMHGAATSGKSMGSIRRVDINAMLSSLTEPNDKIHGTVEIPAYTLHFAGRNAEELRNSLRGSGKLSIGDGRIAALDLLASIQSALAALLSRAEKTDGSTRFQTLTADMEIGEGQLRLSGIDLNGPALAATGQGAIGFDQSLQFDLAARLTASPFKAAIPVQVSGAVDKPHVRPDVKKLAGGAARDTVDGIMKLFRKRR